MAPAEPQIIGVYLDETYFKQQTGMIQTAIVMPDDKYTEVFVEIAEYILARDGRKEFKARDIKRGNVASFREFLQRVVNVVHIVGNRSILRSIIAVDGDIPARMTMFDKVYRQARIALSNNGVVLDSDLENLLKDYCSQYLWFVDHFKYIAPHAVENEFRILLDDRYKNAQTGQQTKLVPTKHGFAWPISVTRLITSTFNSMRSVHQMTDRLPRVSEIKHYWSEDHYGIQAADLLSNLLYNFLKYEMGIRDPKGTTELKRDLLLEVVPGMSVDDAVRKCLEVDGDGLRLKCGKLVKTLSLHPD